MLRKCGWHGILGLVQTNMQELTKLLFVKRFGLYAHRPNFQHVPEWLEEARCDSP